MTDPYVDNVTLLVHSETTNGSAVFADSSYNSVMTGYGGAQHSTAQSKFGGSSIQVGGGKYLKGVPFFLSGGAMTVEAWVYVAPTQSGGGVLATEHIGVTGFVLAFGDGGPGTGGVKPHFAYYISGWVVAQATEDIPTNQWVHIAGSYDGSTMRLFVNGVMKASVATTMPAYSGNVFVGATWTPSYTMTGYIEEARVTSGICRYTTTFTPPTEPFDNPVLFSADDSPTYWSDVTALMHYEGADGDTFFREERHRRSTRTSTGRVTTGRSKFGKSSLILDGGSQVVLSDRTGLGFATNDFTVEGYVWFNVYGLQGQYIFHTGQILIRADGDYWKAQIGGTEVVAANIPITTNVWHHFALVRKTGTVSFFVNGLRIGSITNTTNVTDPGFAGFGARIDLGGFNLDGYVDEFRITKNIARYLNPFVPPTKPFPDLIQYDADWAKVTLMLPLTDVASADRKAHATTKVGVLPYLSATQAKFKGVSTFFPGTAAGVTTAGGIDVADSTDWSLGSGDFTIEAWIYPTEITFYGRTVLNMSTSGGPSLQFNTYTGGEMWLMVSTDGSTWNVSVMTPASAIAINTWSHVAVTRTGGNIRIFTNGVLRVTAAITGSITPVIGGLQVGHQRGGNVYKGYIQDVRITKGLARYTAGFAVPTEPQPAYDFTTTIGGQVKDHNGTPAARRVDIHSQRTGELLGSTVSNASTGYWSFVVDQMCYAVAIDSDATKRNAIVFDRIEPT